MTTRMVSLTGSPTKLTCRVLTLAGLLAAFVLRLHRLGVESLWYDETVSAYLARLPLADMVARTTLDIHPPAYYALLHVWSRLSVPYLWSGLEFLLAFPSLWFGVLSIALLVPIGRLLLDEPTTALAVWLAALHPFLVWYSQEVRMYTVAGALGLLCMLAALLYIGQSQNSQCISARSFPSVRWLAVYVLAAAAGLYTLYYFSFALLAINTGMLFTFLLLFRRRALSASTIVSWIAAQIAVIILFLPWLPLMARQIIEPPVPPWRAPWTSIASLIMDMATSFSAYVVGQSIPTNQVWLWFAVAIVLLFAYYGYTKSTSQNATSPSTAWLPLYAFIPPLTIFIVSAAAVPIFHVRYLVIYAPVFALIAAAGLVFLYSRYRTVFGLVALVLIVGAVYSMARFWRHPDYRPDDHRTAVAQLASDWRPGDAILANAGWIYTALNTYWPTHPKGPNAALPAGPITWQRLTDNQTPPVLEGRLEWSEGTQLPRGIKTGSVDGASSLGWESDEADFFAMGRDDTLTSLEGLGNNSQRIWHYRLYDTVNDPDGVVRDWLASNQRQLSDSSFSGNGFLRLQQYTGDSAPGLAIAAADSSVEFELGMTLDWDSSSKLAAAGSYLYMPVSWRQTQNTDGNASSDVSLATSLRLVGDDSLLWAQHDEPLVTPVESDATDRQHNQILALPIPASTPPGNYRVELILYRSDNLQPLNYDTVDGAASSLGLGLIELGLPDKTPTIDSALTQFDYLELIQAAVTEGQILPGQPLHIDLIWRPKPNDYKDAYSSHISLMDSNNQLAASWTQPLGGEDYPSSMWPTGFPVRDQLDLVISNGLAPGKYRVQLEIVRASDGLQIPSRPHRWWPATKQRFDLGDITVAE